MGIQRETDCVQIGAIDTSMFTPGDPWEYATPFEQHNYQLGYRLAQEMLLRLHYESLATVDQLTGVLNRRGFVEAAHEAMDKAEVTDRFIVFFADLDNFKAVNDRLGHEMGDHVLRIIGASLQLSMPGDIVGRFGGDEFTILHRFTTDAGSSTNARDVIQARAMEQSAHLQCLDEIEKLDGVLELGFGITFGRSLVHRAHEGGSKATLQEMIVEGDMAMLALKKDHTSRARRRDI